MVGTVVASRRAATDAVAACSAGFVRGATCPGALVVTARRTSAEGVLVDCDSDVDSSERFGTTSVAFWGSEASVGDGEGVCVGTGVGVNLMTSSHFVVAHQT